MLSLLLTVTASISSLFYVRAVDLCVHYIIVWISESFIYICPETCYHRITWLLYGISSGQKYKTEDDSIM